MTFSLQKIAALLLILGLAYGNDASAKSRTLKNSEDSSSRVARGALRPKINTADQKKNKRVLTQNSKENPKKVVKSRKPSRTQQRKPRELTKKSHANPALSEKRSRISRSKTQPTNAHAGKKADLKDHRSVRKRRTAAKESPSTSKLSAIKNPKVITQTSPTRKPQATRRVIPGKKAETTPKASPARKPTTKTSVKKQSSAPKAVSTRKPEATPKKTPEKKKSSTKKSQSSKKKESKNARSGKTPVFEAPKEYAVRVKDLSKDQKKKTQQYLGEGLYKEGTIRFAHPDLKSPDYDQFLEIMNNERKNKGKKSGKSLYTFEQHYQNPKYEPTWLNKPILPNNAPKAKFGPFVIR